MAQSFLLIPNFSGRKFAARYGLDPLSGAFWATETHLFLRDDVILPDKPPIFEPSDPPGPTKEEILEQRLAAIETRLTAVEVKPAIGVA